MSRPELQPLEPRVLLSADFSAIVSGASADHPSPAAIVVGLPREALLLPGLELVDPAPDRLGGQILYLDTDGESHVAYDGPVAVGPFAIPAFRAPGELAGREPVILAEVIRNLGQVFAGTGVVFTLERPAEGQPYSTIYLGGDGSAFAAYGSFLGLAEAVDIGNQNPADEAFIFSQRLGADLLDLTAYVAQLVYLIAHEAGHLLGYAHAEPATHTALGDGPAGPLAPVAHMTGPDDGQSATLYGPVHQWLTYNAFLFYDSQFPGSELAQYLGDWQDYGGKHHRTDGDNNDLIEGVFDEDVSGPIFLDRGFHWDIAPQNPLGQSVTYVNHFVAGGDGDEIYLGWNGNASAVTQALRYWEPFVMANYPADPALAYYYLGHVAHLLEDMTVPAHVHNDAHPFRDAYEHTLGEYGNYLLWGYGDAARTSPTGPVGMPSDLVSLFRETINYTEEYPSNGKDGENGPDIPDTGRHRPDLVSRAGGFTGDGAILTAASYNEITILADDLMAWALEQTAALFRLFYNLVDAVAPAVEFATIFGADEAGAVLKPSRFRIIASAQDAISGYEAAGFQFTLERKVGEAWEPLAVDAGGSEFEFTAPGDGLYRIAVAVRDAAGNLGQSGTGYFYVEQASGLMPVYRFWSPVLSRHFYTISEGERDKVILQYAPIWTYEGIAYHAFADNVQPGLTPVYRFWSDTLTAHFYTSNAGERDKLIDRFADVWTFEGVAFHVYAAGAPPAGTSAVHRFWSPRLTTHFYTISQAERDQVLAFYPLVWTYELIAWYAYEA
jgi:hypothetical protein